MLAPIGAIGAIGSSVPVQPCAAPSLRVLVMCLLFFGGLKLWSSEIREARTATVDAAAAEAASELPSGSSALSLGGGSLEAGSSRATGTAVGARL